ncbi:hypothetical protein COT62_03650 [Candidatus Roizmanbacteria bacterium CG09_land_8_20_14_0_10_41_9]|uniref:Uncharacterized protein n=1 Tax=Candidatus Roizmanbacteria bacterium CG09_land_8_20_14_0_10_41_9 TaxID=1974850 RepID=A0A2H0WS18_9BACT|nr:MAG: hypothetical protein COT62_03650 [Candidatus Roizmanbacteria bacterium CG09_land_8_20_14_0_10_41_9]
MELVGSVPRTEEFSVDELSKRYTALLRFLLTTASYPGGAPFISPANLQGIVLDIGFGCCDAGERALRAVGAERVDSIMVPKPRIFTSKPPLNYVAEREAVKSQLVAHLRLIKPSPASIPIRLVTVFDHWGDLIGTEAGREIDRTLAPGGQRLITVRDRANVTTDFGRVWHPLDQRFYPNAAVSIFTK